MLPDAWPVHLDRTGCGQGLVHGASDAKAAYPAKDAVTMEDLAATLFAAMGYDPHATVYTLDNRPMPLTHGRPVGALLK